MSRIVCAAALVVPVALVAGGSVDLSAGLFASLIWLGLGMSVASLMLLVELLRRHEASTVAALLLLMPAVTSITSAVALGEMLHPATLVGMVVATVGVGTVLRREPRRHPRDLAGRSVPGRLNA